jgi:hypothetical protein
MGGSGMAAFLFYIIAALAVLIVAGSIGDLLLYLF